MSFLYKKYEITDASQQSQDIDELFRDIYEQIRVSVLGLATVVGDIPYVSRPNVFSMLADVATGNALLSGGIATAPLWGKVDLTTTVVGILPLANGGTGLASYTQGDMVFFTSGTTLSKLAKNTTATRYVSNTGTANAPAWAQVNLTNGVTGILPVANGGAGWARIFLLMGG